MKTIVPSLCLLLFVYSNNEAKPQKSSPIPPDLTIKIKVAYDEAMKNHLGGEKAAAEYVHEVVEEAKKFYVHPSLGTRIHIVVVEEATLIQNKTFGISPHSAGSDGRLTIRDAFSSSVKESEPIPLVIFTYTDDNDTWTGITPKRSVCEESYGIIIIKWRSDLMKAAKSFGHEFGHSLSMYHDEDEDRRNARHHDPGHHAVCAGQGLMSDMAPGMLPSSWSTCSSRRLQKGYDWGYLSCFIIGGIEDKKASPACSLPQHPPLWSPSVHFNLTIIGLNVTSLKLAFDQALVLAAAYNHDLGSKTLQNAYNSYNSSPDFQCCLCLWALVYINGPNLNRNSRLAAAKDWAAKLRASQGECSGPLEVALVSAMVDRFPTNRTDALGNTTLDVKFAKRMYDIANNKSLHMNNDFVKADLNIFYADTVMNTMPWNYYKTDGTLKDVAKQVETSLDLALSIVPRHPLANHLAIHLFEPSSDSTLLAKAVKAADTLKLIIPQGLGAGLGHLLHMPSHAYYRIGRYHDCVLDNKVAIADDFKYFSDCNVSSNDFYRLNYYTHKHAFVIWAATMSGEYKVAHNFMDKLFNDVKIKEVATQADMKGRVFFSYPSWKYQILITFGKFKEMESLLEPTGNGPLLTYTKSMFYFARSYARASLSNCTGSKEDMKQFLIFASNHQLDNIRLNWIQVKDLLNLSKQILLGRRCRMKCGNCSKSEVEYLSEAVEIEDRFPYDEPRYWPHQVRPCLGAALLRENNTKSTELARAVFEDDLSTPHNPNNGWSLKGMELALRKQGNDTGADKVLNDFTEAWKFADVELKNVSDICF